jgi:hypothetical protein
VRLPIAIWLDYSAIIKKGIDINMKSLFVKRLVLSGIPILVISFFLIENLHAKEEFYGIYSNMQVSEGDYSGFEFIIVPSNEGDFLIFQDAEGWPKKPLLLTVQLGGTQKSDSNLVRFTHPEMGPFEGRIKGRSLHGEFTQMKYKIELTKGKSIWQ